MIYLLKNSPYNEEYILHQCTENTNEIAAIAIESVRQRGFVDDETTLHAKIDDDLKTVTVYYDTNDQTQFYIVTIPTGQADKKPAPHQLNQLLQTWKHRAKTYKDNLPTGIDTTTITTALGIQHGRTTTLHQCIQELEQIINPNPTIDKLVQEITTPTDQLNQDRPNFFYYSVPKTPQEMTNEELVQEIQAAYQADATAEITQSGISTKETVRKRNCEQELVSRPNGIVTWNDNNPYHPAS
jgi:hypothetical protein